MLIDSFLRMYNYIKKDEINNSETRKREIKNKYSRLLKYLDLRGEIADNKEKKIGKSYFIRKISLLKKYL